jgi:hydroxyacylglutathione hydrolase
MRTQHGTEISRLTPARCNIYLISRSGENIIIDSGIQSDRARIRNALERKNLKPEALILTHSHFDHAGNAAWLRKEYDAKIIVHASEREALAAGDMPIPGGTYSFTKRLSTVGRKITSIFRYESCSPDIVVDTFLDLSELGFNGYLMHTPGHSPGEIAVVIDDEAAFTGDSVIGTIPGSPFPPFADDVEELLRSWKKLLDTGCHIFLPGHGKPVTREELAADYWKRMKK